MHVLQVHTTANNHTAVLSCACVVPKISHRYFTFLMLTHSPPRARSTHPAAPSTRHHSRKPAARAARRSASWRCSCGRRRPPAAPPSAARGTPTVSGVHSQWGPQSAGAREHLSRAHGQRGGAAARRRGGAAARRRGGAVGWQRRPPARGTPPRPPPHVYVHVHVHVACVVCMRWFERRGGARRSCWRRFAPARG